MKQRRIKELTINHYEQGSSVSYTPSRTEEYAAVLAQAEAHQDLRFHATSNNVENIVILPWESVIGVNATYETVDVAAPTDTICGGGETPSALVVTPKTPIDSVGIVHQPGGHCTVPAGWYTIESVTLNGEPVNLDTFYANMTERFEYSGGTVNCDEHGCSLVVDCDATSVTYKHIFTYEGESCTLTITQNITPSNG